LRSTTGIAIAYCSALLVALCTGQVVQAQAAPSSSPPAGARFEDSTNELNLEVGKAVLVDCAQPIKQVAVGTGEIAEATAISPTEIMITGKGQGATSLIIWDIHGGRQFFNVTVRPSVGLTGENLDSIRRELKTELPGQTIRVTYTNNSVFLRGTVTDLTSSARAVQIASTAGKVVNLLDVNVPKSDPQILLKVRFAAVDRNLARQLGINLFDLGLGNALGGVSAGQFSPPTISGSSASSSSSGSGVTGPAGSASFSQEGSIFAFFPGLNVGADIHALVTKGVVQMLAEPNVMASDGKEASFLAGGEFPYPVVSGTSGGTAAVSIEYKEYGVRLNFIPTITPRGTIRLQVAPEVSALDYSNEVEISGFEVPGLTTRRVNTEVELKDGQTFIIGGLLDKNMTETFQKIPFLGDIPILGKLFQSQIKNKTDTELIVLVTPEIVAPLPAGTPPPDLKYPGQFLPPNSNIPMHQPDEKTADNTLPPPAPAIPVETLIQSMKPEKPLIIENGTGGFGQGGTAINPGGSSSTSNSTGAAPAAGSGTPQQ
jgi:pilus assembly protein CpaC